MIDLEFGNLLTPPPRDYESFIRSKHRRAENVGVTIDEIRLNPRLFDFQKAIVSWALRKGRAGLFADCGLGKTIMELEWLNQLIQTGNAKRALVLCPLAVSQQVVREAEKFEIETECRIVKSSADVGSGINITNYEKLHKLDPSVFDAVVLNEASILKNATGKVRRKITSAFRDTRFRLTETATPAPNDHMEIGTQSEFLGRMDNNVMKSMFFVHDGGDTSKWRLRRHGEREFWNWVSSWAVSLSSPSSIGFSDEGYALPPLNVIEEIIEVKQVPPGFLFVPDHKVTATTIHEEKRRSLPEKSERVASLVNGNDDLWVCWVDTNYEADAYRKLIPDAVEVRGSDKDDAKEEKLTAFTDSKVRVLITKPEIGGFGLNWQHCHNTTYPAGYSFERWYQSIRRFWRFGQQDSVNAHLIASENELSVVAAMLQKQRDFDAMRSGMAEAMRDGMEAEIYGRSSIADYRPDKSVQVPSWMKS